MAVKRLTNERIQYEDGNGALANAYRLFFYAAGSSTKQNTYNSSTGATPNLNPIVLNALGEPAVEIWLTSGQSYKMGLAIPGVDDPPASFVWTEDNITGVNDTSVSIDEWVSPGVVPTFVSGTSFTLPGDQTSAFHAKRRLKFTVTAGTVYGTILSSVFGALTTVTMTMNAAQVLDSGLTSVLLGLLRADNVSIPETISAGAGIAVNYASGKPTISASGGNTTIPRLLTNVGLAVTPGASAMTVALKQSDGATDATVASPVGIAFRSSAVGSGASNGRSVTAALAMTIASTATLGTVSTQISRVWVAAIDNAGTPELAVMQGLSGTSFTPINENGVISTTQIAAASNLPGTWYSTTARANVPFTVLGYFESTQATAGTWATNPSNITVNPAQRPGAVVQTQRNETGSLATGSTTIPADDTIPQNTEGDQYLSQAITPTSSANLLRIHGWLNLASSAAVFMSATLFQDAVASAISSSFATIPAGLEAFPVPVDHTMVAATAVATTFKVRGGGQSAGTTTFNGSNGGRIYGGTMFSQLNVDEVFV